MADDESVRAPTAGARMGGAGATRRRHGLVKRRSAQWDERRVGGRVGAHVSGGGRVAEGTRAGAKRRLGERLRREGGGGTGDRTPR